MVQLTVLHGDDSLIVLMKPAGLTVHPPSPEATDGQAQRQREETLTDWLIVRFPELEREFPKVPGEIWRPGIVHRLDKDTSGVMVMACTADALKHLRQQFQQRRVEKVYHALVLGQPPEEGGIESVVVRSHEDPTRQVSRHLTFSWTKGTPKPALTAYRRIRTTADDPSASLLELRPKTGRMHQLRVQLATEGWPVLGDHLYGTKASRAVSAELGIRRQMLHALRLGFNHPKTGEWMEFDAPYPPDMKTALTQLGFA